MVGAHKNQRFFPFKSILSLQGLVKMKVTEMTLMGRTLRFLCLLTISQAHYKIFATTNLKTYWGTFIWEIHDTMVVSCIIISFKTFGNVWHCVTTSLELSSHSKLHICALKFYIVVLVIGTCWNILSVKISASKIWACMAMIFIHRWLNYEKNNENLGTNTFNLSRIGSPKRRWSPDR
jgi:hypothetical protein